jgi:hypothetical protein
MSDYFCFREMAVSSIVAIEETETKSISGLEIKKSQNPSTKSQNKDLPEESTNRNS